MKRMNATSLIPGREAQLVSGLSTKAVRDLTPVIPPAPAATTSYRLRLASSPEDIRAAQVLRFLVFNLELKEGLEGSYSTLLDADEFDGVCDHLLVEDLRAGEVVGTYRLQTGLKAAQGLGYYSAQEFDFRPYEPLRPHLVELGRACIRSDHRSFAVLNMLWKGIVDYATCHGARYLIGCSSLSTQDPAEATAAYRRLMPHLVEEKLRTYPMKEFICPMDAQAVQTPKIPRLLESYLLLGARICGPPALDRSFKTVDFLTLLDLETVPPKVAARFLR